MSESQFEIWCALESARSFISSYADQLQGADRVLERIDAALEKARKELEQTALAKAARWPKSSP